MSVTFRKANYADLDAVAAIYSRIHTEEEAGRTTIGWIRDIYPERATAEAALGRNDLYIEEQDGKIVGTAIINGLQVPEYAQAPWQYNVPEEKVCVLHTLVIDPLCKGHGLGKAFVAFYEQTALAWGRPYLRIDTNARNAAARALYKRLGYRETAILPCTFNGIPDVQLVTLEKKAEQK